MKTNEISVLNVPCVCGCSEIKINKYTDDNNMPDYAIDFYINAFYSEQKNNFIEKLKIMWNILIKGTYLYQEIILDQNQYNNFINKACKFYVGEGE